MCLEFGRSKSNEKLIEILQSLAVEVEMCYVTSELECLPEKLLWPQHCPQVQLGWVLHYFHGRCCEVMNCQAGLVWILIVSVISYSDCWGCVCKRFSSQSWHYRENSSLASNFPKHEPCHHSMNSISRCRLSLESVEAGHVSQWWFSSGITGP